MALWVLFQNTVILRKTRVAIVADIIKVATVFFKTSFSNSKIFKRIEIYVKIQSISVINKFAILILNKESNINIYIYEKIKNYYLYF